jgi:hypothetical protein
MRVGQGHPRVAALPDQPDAHLGGVDAHRVVGLVADIEMGFVDLLDVRATVPQQIDGAHRMARISCGGVNSRIESASPNARRAAAKTGTDLACGPTLPRPR